MNCESCGHLKILHSNHGCNECGVCKKQGIAE